MGPSTNKRKVDDISKDKDGEALKKGDVVQVAEEVAAAAAAVAADADADADVDPDGEVDVDGDADADGDAAMPDGEDATGDDDKDDDDGVGSASKRRFFPRVKHLLTAEWEPVSIKLVLFRSSHMNTVVLVLGHLLTCIYYCVCHLSSFWEF